MTKDGDEVRGELRDLEAAHRELREAAQRAFDRLHVATTWHDVGRAQAILHDALSGPSGG